MTKSYRVLAQPRPHGVEQDRVQVGAMDRELRPVVAGVAAAQVANDVLAVATVIGKRPGLDRFRGKLVGEAELGEFAHAVWQQVDADSERQDFRRGLEDPG